MKIGASGQVQLETQIDHSSNSGVILSGSNQIILHLHDAVLNGCTVQGSTIGIRIVIRIVRCYDIASLQGHFGIANDTKGLPRN